jgi:hypothetical protein
MKITKRTLVYTIIKEYGDIAEVMEFFGVNRVGGYGVRKIITRVITVRMAAIIHRVPLDRFMGMLETAIGHRQIKSDNLVS